jgi:formate hydrogenlyase subunit 3/multisubunit Na+/H+ antiporter MnhD subunit
MILKNISFISVFLIICIAALMLPLHQTYSFASIFIGLHFEVSVLEKKFLLFTVFIWLISALASVFCMRSSFSYRLLFVLTFIGNCGLIIASDMISFYLFFTLMSLAAFGLITYDKTQEAKLAAFSYIKFAIFGEVLLFLAIASLYRFNDSLFFNALGVRPDDLTMLLIILGFGTKAGLFLLHPWLPKAHANAPAPVSALLSGVMLKTAILGWIKFLSLGTYTHEAAGFLMVILGFLGIYGGIYGVFQKNLKEVLAYSSISQMGYLILVVGTVLLSSELFQDAKDALMLFIFHHGFVKAALFLLAADIVKNGRNRLNMTLAFIGALVLIGVPFTSGAVAKDALKQSLLYGYWLFNFSSFVTAFLMFRFIFLALKIPAFKKSYDSIFALPLLLLSVVLSVSGFSLYAFDWFEVVPSFAAFAFFVIVYFKQKTIPILPNGDISVLFKPFRLNFFNKTLHEQKLRYSYLSSWIEKIEEKLENQNIAFMLLLVFATLTVAWYVVFGQKPEG